MKTHARYLGIAVLAALLVSSAGCKLFKNMGGGGGAVQSDKALDTISVYAKAYNALIKGPDECIDEYLGAIPDSGPDFTKKTNLFPRQNFAVNDIKTAKDAVAEAKTMAPSSLAHLGPFADQCVADAEKVVTTFEEAYKYYNAETYKDDSGKKGKEIHEQMMAAIKSFDASVKKFDEELLKIEDQQDVSELKKFEGDKDYSYWYRFYTMTAKKMSRLVDDHPKYLEEYKNLETINTQLAAFAKGKGAGLNSVFKTYVSTADEFMATATKLNRAIKETPDSQEADNLKDELIARYNNLISMSDSLSSLESSGMLK
jgi:hypothetical protein